MLTNYTKHTVEVSTADSLQTEAVMNVWYHLPPQFNYEALASFKRSITDVDFSEF